MFGIPEAFAVIVVFTAIQQFEEKFLVPVLMSKTLGVNPLLVFVSMLFGGMIMGIYGFILAVPISVIFSIMFSIPELKDEKLPSTVSESIPSKTITSKKPTSKSSPTKKPVKKKI